MRIHHFGAVITFDHQQSRAVKNVKTKKKQSDRNVPDLSCWCWAVDASFARSTRSSVISFNNFQFESNCVTYYFTYVTKCFFHSFFLVYYFSLSISIGQSV